jgi:hypothetical protein
MTYKTGSVGDFMRWTKRVIAAPRRFRRSERPETAIQARNRDLAADESSSCRAESSKRNGGHSRETRNRIGVNTVSID